LLVAKFVPVVSLVLLGCVRILPPFTTISITIL
jgi:hypothetical protein